MQLEQGASCILTHLQCKGCRVELMYKLCLHVLDNHCDIWARSGTEKRPWSSLCCSVIINCNFIITPWSHKWVMKCSILTSFNWFIAVLSLSTQLSAQSGNLSQWMKVAKWHLTAADFLFFFLFVRIMRQDKRPRALCTPLKRLWSQAFRTKGWQRRAPSKPYHIF